MSLVFHSFIYSSYLYFLLSLLLSVFHSFILSFFLSLILSFFRPFDLSFLPSLLLFSPPDARHYNVVPHGSSPGPAGGLLPGTTAWSSTTAGTRTAIALPGATPPTPRSAGSSVTWRSVPLSSPPPNCRTPSPLLPPPSQSQFQSEVRAVWFFYPQMVWCL